MKLYEEGVVVKPSIKYCIVSCVAATHHLCSNGRALAFRLGFVQPSIENELYGVSSSSLQLKNALLIMLHCGGGVLHYHNAA